MSIEACFDRVALEEGAQACRDKKSPHDNPYSMQEMHMSWAKGYHVEFNSMYWESKKRNLP